MKDKRWVYYKDTVPEDQGVGQDNADRNGSAQAVHTVRAVRHVDRSPDQNDPQYEIDRSRKGDALAQDMNFRGVIHEEGDHRGNRDHKVDESLFVVAPRRFSRVIEIPAEHDQDDQDTVDQVFDGGVQDQHGDDSVGRCQDQADPPEFAL